MFWDIFCKVIDNHGDIGVCWRLSAELAARGEQVRLWVDDAAALAWMAPGGQPGVEVVAWDERTPAVPLNAAGQAVGDVVVEAFGCDPHESFLKALAERAARAGRQPAWINLEYLSAEAYVERCHGLRSPVMSGPAKGLTKRFFYPGFTAATGGLVCERDLAQRQAGFDRPAWRQAAGVATGARAVSLFCYEPPALPQLLRQLASPAQAATLLVTAGRSAAAAQAALAGLPANEQPPVRQLPLLTQRGFDELLWACDLNFVRGEDSLVRALWAGQPLVWHIYPQHDGVHMDKLQAFLDWYGAPASLRACHLAWNEGGTLPPLAIAEWAEAAQDARRRLWALAQAPGRGDLVDQLMAMAREGRRAG